MIAAILDFKLYALKTETTFHRHLKTILWVPGAWRVNLCCGTLVLSRKMYIPIKETSTAHGKKLDITCDGWPYLTACSSGVVICEQFGSVLVKDTLNCSSIA